MGGLKMIPDINKINELNLMLHMLSSTGQIASRIFSTAFSRSCWYLFSHALV